MWRSNLPPQRRASLQQSARWLVTAVHLGWPGPASLAHVRAQTPPLHPSPPPSSHHPADNGSTSNYQPTPIKWKINTVRARWQASRQVPWFHSAIISNHTALFCQQHLDIKWHHTCTWIINHLMWLLQCNLFPINLLSVSTKFVFCDLNLSLKFKCHTMHCACFYFPHLFSCHHFHFVFNLVTPTS